MKDATRQRLNTLAANWRALALRGLVALLFGLVLLFWPGLVFAVLALLFGIYAVVDGAITFVPALRSSDRGARRWLPLAEGAVGVIAGLVALLWAGMAGSGLVYVIVGWALATGVLKILTAILLRAEVENGWLLAGSGALSVLFGVLLAALAGSDVPFLAPLYRCLRGGSGPGLDRIRLPIAGAERMNAWWKSPRGYASLGDDPLAYRGLCSRGVMQSRRNKRSKGRYDRRPEHG